jgi:hypothetical protein
VIVLPVKVCGRKTHEYQRRNQGTTTAICCLGSFPSKTVPHLHENLHDCRQKARRIKAETLVCVRGEERKM